MELVERIKFKTAQNLTQMDEFTRKYGVITGMGMAITSVMAGIGGLTAIAASTGTAAATASTAVATVGALAATPVLIGATPLAAAGVLLLGGGYIGLGLAGLGKIYQNIRGDVKNKEGLRGNHFLNCVDNEGNTVKVKAEDVYKQIELGTFNDNYKSLLVTNKNNETKEYGSEGLKLQTACALVLGEDKYSSAVIKNVDYIRRTVFQEKKHKDSFEAWSKNAALENLNETEREVAKKCFYLMKSGVSEKKLYLQLGEQYGYGNENLNWLKVAVAVDSKQVVDDVFKNWGVPEKLVNEAIEYGAKKGKTNMSTIDKIAENIVNDEYTVKAAQQKKYSNTPPQYRKYESLSTFDYLKERVKDIFTKKSDVSNKIEEMRNKFLNAKTSENKLKI